MTATAAPEVEAITTERLTKRYGAITAVDDLSIRVECGEIFGFLGPNGAGKTTTMRMLLGLVRPTSGTAHMLGMDVAAQLEAILRRTGSIIENPTFYPFLSGRENLRIVARLTATADGRIDDMLALVDLSEDGDRKFSQYSLGMKQRLAVAASLIDDPDLLILDEPANGLDPAGVVEMRNLMKRLKDEGKTVFISSHVLHEIEQICDRIAILNHGRVLVQGRVEALLKGGNQIEVRLVNMAEATRVLRSIPWIENIMTEDGTLVVTAPHERSAEVNEALAGAGLYASEIRLREKTLEQYFLGVTTGEAAA
jgi:ABC-2 type transport system ATP-binding protein